MSTSQYETLSVEQLHLREEQLCAQIVETGAAIVDVVAADLPRFLKRETKKRFLGNVDFGSSMDDDALKALKSALDNLAAEVQGTLRAELTARDVWLTDKVGDDRKSLEGNAAVWTIIQKVSHGLSELLAAHGFPADHEADGAQYNVVYRTPKYFIEHVYCPGLVEAYWKQVEEVVAIRAISDTLQTSATREVLEERWNRS